MKHRTRRSSAAFARARKVLVGGVNSPVRAFNAVGGHPPFIARAEGSHIIDLDGNTYVDYVGSYGPAILGHAHGPTVKAIQHAATRGASYGAPTLQEAQLAEAVVAAFDSIEKVRFVSSGTEAVMTAVRLARAATGRPAILKCIGCYHGHSDAMLVAAGSGATTLGVPSSPGVPAGVTADTILVPYNDPAAVEAALDRHGKRIAAMLVEPVAGNMGLVPPADGYLPALRRLCDRHGALLIFDEVITGFRLAPGGAQSLYGVRPDLTTLGKIIGGGLPVGAIGGPAGIMDLLAPVGPVYQAGTLSGNPLAMAAGLAALEALQAKGFYQRIARRTDQLVAGLAGALRAAGLDRRCCINHLGSMFTLFFTPGPVTDYASATAADTRAFASFFHAMLRRGFYLPPSQYETLFVSSAHTHLDVARTLTAAAESLRDLPTHNP